MAWTITVDEAKEHIADQLNMDLTDSEDDSSVQNWLEEAVEVFATIDDFWFWEKVVTLILVADQQDYEFPSDYSGRVKGDSFAMSNTPIAWMDTREEMDRALGPKWRDGSTTGAVRAVTQMNDSFYLGYTPDSAFVAAHPTISYVYYRNVDYSSGSNSLGMPRSLRPHLVKLACIMGAYEEEERERARLWQEFWQRDVVHIRGIDWSVMSSETIKRPIIKAHR